MTTKQTFVFTQAELKQVLAFAQQYPDSLCVEVAITNDGDHTLEAQVSTCLNDYWVNISTIITHGKTW
jgi:hypothetical protein